MLVLALAELEAWLRLGCSASLAHRPLFKLGRRLYCCIMSSSQTAPSPTIPDGELVRLQKAWRERKLVLCLGAGVSIPYGLPPWNELVLTLLIDEFSKMFKGLLEHYRRPFGSWLAETFGLTPLMLARLAQKQFANEPSAQSFAEYVAEMMYLSYREPHHSTALTAIADLIQRSELQGRSIPLVITLNFDNLLELELEKRGVAARSVHSARRTDGKGVPILHPHGFLPKDGNASQAELVFAEEEYHQLSYSTVHWAQIELLHALRTYTILFVGLSMSDPNLRRLLDATREEGINAEPPHFLFRQNYDLTPAQRLRAAETIDERVRSQFRESNPPMFKSPAEFEDAIRRMLDVPKKYDQSLFADMGVRLIWYNDHNDIPVMLGQIPPD